MAVMRAGSTVGWDVSQAAAATRSRATSSCVMPPAQVFKLRRPRESTKMTT